MRVPTDDEAITITADRLKARAKRKEKTLSDANANKQAKDDIAAGGARNNAGELSAEAASVFFLRSIKDYSTWAKKGAVFNETTDILIARNDPVAAPPAGSGFGENKGDESLRKLYIDLKGYMNTIEMLEKKTPAAADLSSPRDRWTSRTATGPSSP